MQKQWVQSLITSPTQSFVNSKTGSTIILRRHELRLSVFHLHVLVYVDDVVVAAGSLPCQMSGRGTSSGKDGGGGGGGGACHELQF